MSKKMQDLICGTLSLVITSLLLFGLLYLCGAFVEGTFRLSRDTREVIIFIYAMAMVGNVPLAVFCLGPFVSNAIEERWKD